MKNTISMRYFALYFFLILGSTSIWATSDKFSTAGFFELEGSNRHVSNMNIGWRFYKGSMTDGHTVDFDDSTWDKVSLPHGLELVPEEASGNINYQGEAWYRKHLAIDKSLEGKKVFFHFEGIMGKSKVWINGTFVKEYFGGYLPIVVDATKYLKYGERNIIAICADNSDDGTYGPGKPQGALDFTYFGGIYRDCWMITHEQVYITDPNFEDVKASGGVLVHHSKVSDSASTTLLKLHLKNDSKKTAAGKAVFALRNKQGEVVATTEQKYAVNKQQSKSIETTIHVEKPTLWSPENPYLYNLDILLVDEKGNTIDGYSQRLGIRSIDLRGKDGLWLNGKPYDDKLVGVNRHQEFAIIGNALPNSLHWRDAKKMRDAGVRIIRATQYPHDPAFLDACDEFGIFVIVTVAGWQFWNNDPIFGERIYSDIRNMVRRDRNHASLFMWEPVLNETSFPLEFALQAKKCVEEEFPYQGGNYSSIDPGSKGSEHYPVIFSHPRTADRQPGISVYNASVIDPKKSYFTREFGDNVDDWASHNSNSRVHRSWGEVPMLIQAQHYAAPSYSFTCLEALYSSPKYHIGGTLWHAFDHQRGYHPQTFYGGIMDLYRQSKTSYYMFKSQRPATENPHLPAESGPMIYIANEMTPFSPSDVTVYSNCEEIRLSVLEGEQVVYKRSSSSMKMPSPIITFKDVYDFMAVKSLARAGKHKQIYILAEGLVNGEVVVTEKRVPSFRPTKLRLRVDDDGMQLRADGSDIVTIIAEVVDDQNTVKRLNNQMVKFSIEGEGKLLANSAIANNPAKSQWGSAPILVQATNKSGKIKIKAEVLGYGLHSIADAELVIESVESSMQFTYLDSEVPTLNVIDAGVDIRSKENNQEIDRLKKEINFLKRNASNSQLKEVEKQQDLFGEPF